MRINVVASVTPFRTAAASQIPLIRPVLITLSYIHLQIFQINYLQNFMQKRNNILLLNSETKQKMIVVNLGK